MVELKDGTGSLLGKDNWQTSPHPKFCMTQVSEGYGRGTETKMFRKTGEE
jgi:hypothetical protein